MYPQTSEATYSTVFFRGHILAPSTPPLYAGDTTQRSLPRALLLLHLAGETGRLQFRSGKQTIDIFLEYGQITYAMSSTLDLRLGEILIRNQILPRDKTTQALRLAQERDRPLGQILLDSRFLPPDAIQYALLTQCRERLFEAFRWKAANYRFFRGQITGASFPFTIDLLQILRDGVFLHTDIAAIREKLSHLQENRIARSQHPYLAISRLGLAPRLQLFAEDITNRDSLRDILLDAEVAGLSEEETKRLLYLLFQLDLLLVREANQSQTTRNQLDELDALVKRLKAQTRYDRLGLPAGASKADVKKAYRQIARHYHPDQLPPGTPPEIRKRKEEIFALLSDAYEALLR